MVFYGISRRIGRMIVDDAAYIRANVIDRKVGHNLLGGFCFTFNGQPLTIDQNKVRAAALAEANAGGFG